jgi:hypothetical protein
MSGPSDPPEQQPASTDAAPRAASPGPHFLPDSLGKALNRYTSTLDRDLPGVLSGLYVVGSVALGDYTPKLSDVDLVAVSDEKWSPEDLNVAAQKAHHYLSRRRHPVRVAYASFAQLAADPTSSDIACFENTTRLAGEALANAFTWHILATQAIAIRGPQHPQVAVSQTALQEWAGQQLHDHWRKWLESAQHHHRTLLFRRSVAGVVLEVSRLYETATTGQVLSKLDAGQALLAQLNSQDARILKDSTGYRQGYHTSMYWAPLERRHEALELIDELTASKPARTDE